MFPTMDQSTAQYIPLLRSFRKYFVHRGSTNISSLRDCLRGA